MSHRHIITIYLKQYQSRTNNPITFYIYIYGFGWEDWQIILKLIIIFYEERVYWWVLLFIRRLTQIEKKKKLATAKSRVKSVEFKRTCRNIFGKFLIKTYCDMQIKLNQIVYQTQKPYLILALMATKFYMHQKKFLYNFYIILT